MKPRGTSPLGLQSQVIRQVVAAKTGSPNMKTSAPDVHRSSSLRTTGALECSRGRALDGTHWLDGRWVGGGCAEMAPAKKRKKKETHFLKVGGDGTRWFQQDRNKIVKNGAHRLEHKDDTHRKGEERKKKKRWRPGALAKEREGMMTAPTSLRPRRIFQQTPAPQTNCFKISK